MGLKSSKIWRFAARFCAPWGSGYRAEENSKETDFERLCGAYDWLRTTNRQGQMQQKTETTEPPARAKTSQPKKQQKAQAGIRRTVSGMARATTIGGVHLPLPCR